MSLYSSVSPVNCYKTLHSFNVEHFLYCTMVHGTAQIVVQVLVVLIIDREDDTEMIGCCLENPVSFVPEIIVDLDKHRVDIGQMGEETGRGTIGVDFCNGIIIKSRVIINEAPIDGVTVAVYHRKTNRLHAVVCENSLYKKHNQSFNTVSKFCGATKYPTYWYSKCHIQRNSSCSTLNN